MDARKSYESFFDKATGYAPYDYQVCLALGDKIPELIDIPTGLGKTAAVIVAWLYRRRAHPDEAVRQSTPRRVVYCLPMRTLVEQTADAARMWTEKLAEHDRQFRDEPIAVHVLMGGEEKTDWDERPEQDAILIGTQDMLLSRALNRGYAMSRYRWPVHFALLNNDCLWVFDETQLMGVGLTTAAQLQGLRTKLNAYGVTGSLWMSATLDESRLSTIDHPRPDEGWTRLALSAEDRAQEAVNKLIQASKPCAQACAALRRETDRSGYETSLAEEVMRAHRPGTLTLVVVNRVGRAQRTYQAVRELGDRQGGSPNVRLIHSRFRPVERRVVQKQALDERTISPDGPGRIVVTTQAVEAGVDISATTLFTELAAWSSLVQRFGRCNRRGICGDDSRPEAEVFWIDIDTSDTKKSKDLSLPYSVGELDVARKHVATLSDVGPASLETVVHEEQLAVVHTIRRKDILELWDTTPDLAGNDLDVSRYIRDADDTDVQVYWRQWDLKERNGSPPDPRGEDGELVFPAPTREELCAVSITGAKKFLEDLRRRKANKKSEVGEAWRWNPLERSWEAVSSHEVRAGMMLLLHVDAGGYDARLGWTGDAKHKPTSEPPAVEKRADPESMDADAFGKAPVPLSQHLEHVTREAEALKDGFNGMLEGIPWESIITAARWHDD